MTNSFDPVPAATSARPIQLLRDTEHPFRTLTAYLRAKPRAQGLLLSEFLSLGLESRPTEEAQTYLGAYGAAKLALAINKLSNRRGLVADKLLFDAMLRGAGLPVPDLRGVWGRTGPLQVPRITSASGLATLMSQPGALPLFGKPAMGERSMDSLGINRFDPTTGAVGLTDGQSMALDDLVDHLRGHYSSKGYLFQGFIDQHPALTRIVGPTVGTVRLVTLIEGGEIHVLRAIWKIPRLGTMADNLWRGNLCAAVDPATGQVGQALTALRNDAPWTDIHPDTGQRIEGIALPHWPRVVRLVRRSAGLLHVIPLIGWDLAIGPDGPIFVEANTSPSLDTWQYPTRQGALAGEVGERLRRASGETLAGEEIKKQARSDRRRSLVRHRLGRN